MKMITKSIALTLLATTFTFASTIDTSTTYAAMSTAELQKYVEEHSKAGDLPFQVGLELMKRWTHS